MDRRVYENYVIRVAENGSLTKAAAALGISQPALSSGLNALEKELGITIFNRKTNPVSFTEEGELYYELIMRTLTLNHDFELRIESLRKDKNFHAVVGAPVAYLDSIVADAVSRLRQTHPEFVLSMRSASVAELAESATKGEINCFISTSDELPENLEKRMISKEQIFLCIPSDNPINAKLSGYKVTRNNKGSVFDYSMLNGEQFILLEEGLPLQIQINAFLRKNKISPRCGIRVNQVSTALNLAIRGGGICFASEDALSNISRPSSICVYPLPDDVTGRELYVAYDKQLFMPEAAKSLINLICEAGDGVHQY